MLPSVGKSSEVQSKSSRRRCSNQRASWSCEFESATTRSTGNEPGTTGSPQDCPGRPASKSPGCPSIDPQGSWARVLAPWSRHLTRAARAHCALRKVARRFHPITSKQKSLYSVR